ncbi:MAG: methylated-DNA--[protein]-cysteine S-methyltransferase, partial [Caulobacteraceae bacterium]
MTGQAYSLFSTALGVAGVVWSERGVAGVELPNAAERRTRARLSRRFPASAEASPPAAVSDAIN